MCVLKPKGYEESIGDHLPCSSSELVPADCILRLSVGIGHKW